MKKTIIATAMSLCMVSLSSVTLADTLIMRDGTRVEGTVVSIAARTITFRHADGVSRRYPTSRVEGLEFVSADRANPRAVNGRRLEAPAGTELVVRTVETIDSRNAGADQVFSAMVEERVSDAAGHVIVPERSSAQLIVRQLSTGAPTSSPELTLDVQSIAVNGRRYLVTLGTIGGAITGSTNANARAMCVPVSAPGVADAEVLTGGRDVHVPAETVLRFRLKTAVTLQPEG